MPNYRKVTLWKSQKAMKLSPLHFHLWYLLSKNNSLTRWVSDSPIRRVGESLREKRQHRNSLFAHAGCRFPSEICKKRPEYDNFGLFLRPSIIALCKKSSFYFKSVDFLPKNDRYACFRTVEFIEILSIKKAQALKVPKCDIFDLFNFNDFYVIKSL
jgi:hypothetical protein